MNLFCSCVVQRRKSPQSDLKEVYCKPDPLPNTTNNNEESDLLSAKISEDPRIPLTKKQLYSLVQSWKGISREIERTGINLFVKMFELHPAILQVFVAIQKSKFPGLSEAAQNEALIDHATSVMRVIDNVFKSIGQADRFFDLLHWYADFHAAKVTGFSSDFFWKIEEPFLYAVKDTLGDRFSERIEQIYQVAIRLIITTLVNECDSRRMALEAHADLKGV